MPAPASLSTRVLLVCAAIGVASGLVGSAAGWITTAVLLTAPMLYGLVLGAHVIPGIIAQEALHLPWVALLSHVLAALVASATAPQWAGRFIGTALLFGGIQEGVAALTRYRVWKVWRYFISAAIIGILVAVVVALAVDLGQFALWAQIVYVVVAVLGPVVWTALGLLIGAKLRQAGIGRRPVRR
ncbi:ECF transporter S component [Microbacterium luticocti]|uniref:ECF transporter S component n=1 Tax=Microbacterium luticocti TaxID=451764 RepID=UPI00048EC911|nr:ECF transporter S component [Microbacterium luticocti]